MTHGCACESGHCGHSPAGCNGVAEYRVIVFGFVVTLCIDCLTILRVTTKSEIESVEPIV